MKTDLAPKYAHTISNETKILWFQMSNRYVVVSNHLYSLIRVFLDVEHEAEFIATIKEHLIIDTNQSNAIYQDLSIFLEDANKTIVESTEIVHNSEIPKTPSGMFYNFNGEIIKINFGSQTIQSLIHPQIAHHKTDSVLKPEITFDIFKTNDDLHLFKDSNKIGSYKTSMFHLLQGKFALELTTAIHHKSEDDWIATFHASTVTNGDEAIMIIGDSGNGKSTLSALLMAHEFDLLSDDFTPLHKDLNLYRYPSAVSIKKGAFEVLKPHFKNFDALKIHTNGPKKVNLKYLPPNTTFNTSKSSFPCQKIVRVKFDSTKPSELKQVSVEDILETLIPESWISPQEIHALQFLNWLEHIKCYELCYSDNDFAISKFKGLFDI